MAQLSPDNFAHDGGQMTLAEAHRFLATRVAAVDGVETVALRDAFGRVLAETVHARVDLPPFANSAVDGYAVRHADVATDGPTRLRIVARVQAGAEAPGPLGPGTAARVFTGAPMPAGADTVYMQEDVTAEAGAVSVPPGLKRGANARPAGEELARGAAILEAGRRLRPADVALAAACGHHELVVRRRLRIAVFSTGDELVEPGRPLKPAGIYDSNRLMLLGLGARLGAEVTDLGVLADDLDPLTAALSQAARTHDLVVTSGGVSQGEADFVKTAVERIGRLDVWRFAIKPGRPLAIGAIEGAAFVGLPGNPVAVHITFTQIVRALIAALAGETWTRPVARPVRAGFAYRKKPNRHEFVRVHLEAGADGWPVARKFAVEGAGIVSSLTRTDGVVELGEDVTEVRVGDLLPFSAFDEIE